MRVGASLAVLAIASVVGCGSAGMTPSRSPRPPLPSELTPSPYRGDAGDIYVGIDEVVRGFAGVYYDPAPALYIALVDPAEGDAARSEVARVLGLDTSDAQIRPAKYNYAQLRSWQFRLESDCGVRDTTLWFVDQLHNVVHVGVSAQGSVDGVRACGVAVGMPSDALDVAVEGPFTY